jgi:hypothetical protein
MKFIVLSTQRSGTNLLRSYLNFHKNIKCEEELPFNWMAAMLYLAGKIEGVQGAGVNNKLGQWGLRYKKEFPRNYYNSLQKNTGFNLQYNQINPGLSLSEFNIIHLVRSKVFEQAISFYIMENCLRGIQGKHFPKYHPNSIDFKQKIKINRLDLEYIMQKTKEQVGFWSKKLQKEKVNYLTIYYENLFDDRSLYEKREQRGDPVIMPRETAQKIFDFLKVEYQDLYSYLKRVNTPDYHNYITNWEEIKDLSDIKIE